MNITKTLDEVVAYLRLTRGEYNVLGVTTHAMSNITHIEPFAASNICESAEALAHMGGKHLTLVPFCD